MAKRLACRVTKTCMIISGEVHTELEFGRWILTHVEYPGSTLILGKVLLGHPTYNFSIKCLIKEDFVNLFHILAVE